MRIFNSLFSSLSILCFFVVIIIQSTQGQNTYQVYINEIRPDNAGADSIEFIELIGPAGTSLTGFKIIHYNGASSSDGGLWTHVIGTFTIPDDGVTDNQGNALGFYVLGLNSGAASIPNVDETLTSKNLQNGPDGLVLYDAQDNILDAVAWGGAGDLPIDDPGTVTTSPPTTANNYLHVTVSDDNTDNSIQAPNNVLGDDGTGWQVAMATPGALNATQTTGDLSLPVQLALFRAIAGDKQVTLEWVTASEVQNLGFEVWKAVGNRNYELLSSYQSNPDLLGQLNSNSETHYSLIDQMVANGITYHYKLVDVSVNGSRTEHGPVTATPQATEVEVTTIDAEVPMEFELYVNYPNPFNPTTTIRFDIPTLSEMDVVPVALNIYTITGQKVRTLFDGVVEPGVHELVWDGTSDNGRQLSSGVYIAVLTSEQLQKSIRMILSQ